MATTLTRRITRTILAVITATLLLSGAGTAAVAALTARHRTATELSRQASDVAAGVADAIDDTSGQADPVVELRRRLALVRRITATMHLDEVGIVTLRTDGTVSGEHASEVDDAEIRYEPLAAGEVLSGASGRTLWAVASAGPINRRDALAVVVLTRPIETGIGVAAGWLLVASALTLAAGGVVARGLGRRLTRPVRDASEVAAAIAGGDLTARVDPVDRHAEDLAALGTSINTLAEALQRARAVEQEFLMSVTHDLRTPMSSIRGYAEAVLDGAASPERAATVILSESRRLERLVSDLLDLAKLQASGFRLELEEMDLTLVAQSCIEGFERPGARSTKIDFVATSAPVPRVVADRDRVEQILANLLENATRYATSRVVVSASAEGRFVALRVEDDGPGIAPHDLPHVFDRLYVSREAPRRAESGSGLGLAISHGLAAAMGGRLSAGVAAAGGAAFTLTVPAVPSAGLSEWAPPEPPSR